MENRPRVLRTYITDDGKTPFKAWVSSFTDKRIRARILQRLDRLQLGNFGDCKSVGAGVYELRMQFGAGYRIYFGIADSEIVILLCGGDKRSQNQDIQLAHQYWKAYQQAHAD